MAICFSAKTAETKNAFYVFNKMMVHKAYLLAISQEIPGLM